MIPFDSETYENAISLLQRPREKSTIISEDLMFYFALTVPINMDIIGPAAADMRS